MTNASCDSAPNTTLMSLDKALSVLLSMKFPNPKTEKIALSGALNRINSRDIYSSINVPPANNSAVDGYALRIEDFTDGQEILISQRIPAGCSPKKLEKNTVARIFTGAHIPEGANCVVMQENTSLNSERTSITISGTPTINQNIRPMGQDINSGDCILNKGEALTPQRLGLAASIGIAEIDVFEPLTVAILSTGDELVEPGTKLEEGQIYNSNRYLLSGFLNSLNFDIFDLGLVRDNLESTLSALQQAASKADVIITTGGASVGEEDYIQAAISKLGTVDFWKVAIKPGKPLMLGQINNTPVLGLPGNPGAVFVTFMILARPFLLYLQGLCNTQTKPYPLAINFDINKAGIRREFLRVIRKNNKLEIHPNQSSGMLSSASWAEGLAIIAEGTTPKKGDFIDFIPFNALLNLNN